MAEIGPLRLSISGSDEAQASLASAVAALEALPQIAEMLLQGEFRSLVLGNDFRDLIVVKPLDRATSGTGKLECLQILPSDRYLKFVTAIVAEGQDEIALCVRHGWSILSVGGVAVPTVADAGGVASLSGGRRGGEGSVQ